MVDFLMISTRSTKRGVIEVYPKFIIKKSSDLMIRGGDFYAIWMEEENLWSTDEHDAIQLIDRELKKYAEENKEKFDARIHVLYMWDSSSGMVDTWHKYCQKQMRDNFKPLDEDLIFANHKTIKKDYASRKLNYPLEKGDITAYDRLMSVLYSEEERHKIEWAIGSIVQGDSKKIQKFMVLYGAAGTGKSTVLDIIQQLFEGYYSVFDAKALGSSSNSFALEAFKGNPLVAIQHDGDLSRIEDNTRLNSLVSHEMMTVNEKFKSTYANQFKCFLFMGTNRPVKITDAKSGLIRRLIDVSPTGEKLSIREYRKVTKQVSFELGAIAYHCREVYLENPGRYDNYVPKNMLGASNDFYNFVIDSYHVFKREDGVTLKAAWEMYKTYCDDAKVLYPFSQRVFKEELKNYFNDHKERFNLDDGSRVRSYYSGFRTDKFKDEKEIDNDTSDKTLIDLDFLNFREGSSILDDILKDCPAQYANTKGTPKNSWGKVSTKLSDINSSKLHYVRPPDNHIVIDFDILGDDGKKDFKRNLEEAKKWPATYAELSKSGGGIHLHYIYTGDVKKLNSFYTDHIEVKVFSGNSAIRRKLTKCNDIPIATISSGLPLKGDKTMVDLDVIKNEKHIRALIKKGLNREVHPNTASSISYINKILDDSYNQGLFYDVSDMKNDIYAFAAGSTNQAQNCIKIVNSMKFKSDTQSSALSGTPNDAIIFFDVEVFPNLFVLSWKMRGEGNPIVNLINPSPDMIEDLLQYKLVGFNNRRYDNHIVYAALMGYNNDQLYNLSQRIISGDKNGFFGEAYNLSYTDVYDFSSVKQGLKKFQIDLGINHQELGLPWDKPVPNELWSKVADYCGNDVISTEATFESRLSDFAAREILADLAGMSVNDTTNSLTTKIIFGNDRKPQSQFNWRDMGDYEMDRALGDDFSLFDSDNRPIFPGYKYESGISTYRGEKVGEGGYVYAVPGIYGDVAVLDIASMHPNSIINENLFGDIYTERFRDLVDARIAIKHQDWDLIKKANSFTNEKMLGGKLEPYIDKMQKGEIEAFVLSTALKIAINSVYGLTSAKFDNPFRDIRNKDNIVAKRGALFMINLKHEVMKKGYRVVHIKTDSIKIADADDKIIKFVIDYGKMYGYTFEHEDTYDKMCLVNDAVFIAKSKNTGNWEAVGTQFQVPYVFKKLFSGEDILFGDLCETKSVTTALYLDMNEGLPDVSELEKERERLLKKDPPMTKVGLDEEIDKGHNYIFIGRVGRFCPIKNGHGGGILVREKDGKYHAASGTKGYRWMEAEMVISLGKEESIDISYYEKLLAEAKKQIESYGNFDWFISDKPYSVDDNYIYPF